MSVDDAEKRLRERQSTRPATTQPMSEMDRLREENERLRENNYALRQEVASLREALDHLMHREALANPTTRPTSGPAQAAAAPAAGGVGLVGHWRGGSPQDGTAFLVTFDADGTYQQNWIFPPRSEPGHYQIDGDGTVEMWSDQSPPGQPHHLWSMSAEPDRVTLAPLLANGEPSNDPPQVLTRMKK
ncbi:MAG TPA: hypothetical protein VHY37_11680 [Tepidisphaeraceae bacterium]|nr:hypothetical protein [Tepidisphaeraceae bacterium]